jgi:xanthine dehydrogenase molybdopterin-binding subunit B
MRGKSWPLRALQLSAFKTCVSEQVADTAEHARKAAAKVVVGYDTTMVGPPVLSIEDAINQNSYHQLHWLALNSMYPVGDILNGFAGADLIIEGAEVHMFRILFQLYTLFKFSDFKLFCRR